MTSLPYGTRSSTLLDKCHPDLKTLFYAVNEIIQCTILPSTIRTVQQQIDFVKGTNLTGVNPEKKILSKTMHSKHLPQADGLSHAVDVAPDPVDFEKRNFTLDQAYFAGHVMMIAMQLKKEGKITNDIRYGGDWNSDEHISDESFQDLDHFEIIS